MELCNCDYQMSFSHTHNPLSASRDSSELHNNNYCKMQWVSFMHGCFEFPSHIPSQFQQVSFAQYFICKCASGNDQYSTSCSFDILSWFSGWVVHKYYVFNRTLYLEYSLPMHPLNPVPMSGGWLHKCIFMQRWMTDAFCPSFLFSI